MKKKIKITVVLSLVYILSLTGCGSGGSGESTEVSDGAGGSGGMGRYVEESFELNEGINRNGGLNVLADGSMTILSYNGGLYRSEDGGAHFENAETDYFPMMQGVYAMAAQMAPDGTVAVTCSGEMPEAAREVCSSQVADDWEGNYCIFVSPAGECKVVDFGFSQDDGSCISSLCFKEDNRLFAGDMNGKIYEVDIERESLKELFMMEGAGGAMGFCGDVLMVVGSDRLYLYDLEAGAPGQQDAVADAFIGNVLSDGTTRYTGGGYPLIVFGGEDGVMYIGCVNGLYRHVLYGSTVEQVIDGALSTFGDGNALFFGKELENREFLVQFSGELMRYHFDETIPAMPDKEVRIYSLRENRSVRSAVASYKREHTDTYVRYEVGMGDEDGMTEEDAVKKLNTKILSGEGPDVIILDGLPVDSYLEKGMLADLNGLLENVGNSGTKGADGAGKSESGAEEINSAGKSDDSRDRLFPGIVEGFREEDGCVYVMPLCVEVPLLVGDTSVINEIEDLESFADAMEDAREVSPEGGLLGIYDAETLLHLFGMVSADAWTDRAGEVDRQAVADFLTQVKRIYDAEYAGALPDEVEALKSEDTEMEQYGVDAVENRMEVCNNVLNIRRGYARIAAGYVDGIQLCLDNVTSVVNLEEGMRYKSFPGQMQDCFTPKVLVGLSAKSENAEAAGEFIERMFSAEEQENMYDGFPVNEAAFAEEFALYAPGDSNGSMTFAGNDGAEQELELLWPDEEEQRVFTELVEGLRTPVRSEAWFSELVYETGVKVLEDDLSVEEAVDEIEKKAALHLAE